MRIKDLLGTLDRIAPFKLAEAWDNVGLLVGDSEREISAILVGLDPTGRLLDEAIAQGTNTIITHHPLIFHPLPAINTAVPTGLFLEKALTNKITVIACHTNLDSAHRGVSDVLADSLGLVQTEPLIPDDGAPGCGIGRIGNFPQALNQVTFMTKIFQTLGLPGVQVAGLLPDRVSRVAVCGGSGSEFAETALRKGADVYLSAEIKHSTARWAQDCGFCIIDGTHYATEQPVVKYLVSQLKQVADCENWGVPIRQTQTEEHPFTYKNRELFR